MRHRLLVLMGALAAVIVVSLVLVRVARQAPTTAAATTPRTPWGDPDLQGVWSGITPTPLERPGDGGKVILTDEEAEQLEQELVRRWETSFGGGNDPVNTTGSYNAVWQDRGRAVKGRTSLIVDPPDGKIPPLTPEALARSAARSAPGRGTDGPEDRSTGERCLHWERLITGGVNQYYRIVQAPGYVAINTQRLHENRIIPLDGRPHLPQDVRQWNGDSVGHWEGNTLVVDTTNFSDKANYRGSGENLHVVERFTRVGDTINYEATLDDPTTWTRPWTLGLPLTKDPEGSVGIFEYACHEGNYGMVGILAGARAEEKAAAGKKRSN
jgi:hypothetical protein